MINLQIIFSIVYYIIHPKIKVQVEYEFIV